MNDLTSSILLLLFFFLAAPIGAALLAEDVAHEELFARPRAWIEAHYPGGMLTYLVNCPRCLSHWTMALLTILGFHQWSLLPYEAGVPAAILSWAAGTRLAQHWLSHE